jgi:hypothetical protein
LLARVAIRPTPLRPARAARSGAGGCACDPGIACGDQQAEQDEGAGRQDGDQQAVIFIAEQLQRPRTRNDHVDARKQRARADQFARAAQQCQYPQQADAHGCAVPCRCQRRILGCEGFDTCQHDAVGDDQRNEDAQHQIELVQPGVEREIETGDQSRDDQDEHRDAYFVGNQRAQRRHGAARQRHHQYRRERQADRIDQRVADRQQRAQPEQLHQRGVVFPQALATDVAVGDAFFRIHGRYSCCDDLARRDHVCGSPAGAGGIFGVNIPPASAPTGNANSRSRTGAIAATARPVARTTARAEMVAPVM